MRELDASREAGAIGEGRARLGLEERWRARPVSV
jgi:hypothetical protein